MVRRDSSINVAERHKPCDPLLEVLRPTAKVETWPHVASHNQSGFTLLELMLSLGLTIVILLAISMAVDLHLRSFDSRRKVLEESQLARAILTIIADDIRSTMQQYEQDLSALEQMLSSAAEGQIEDAAAALGGNEGSTDDLLGDLEVGMTDETATATQDLASAVTIPSTPGIYGNQYQLQLDVSRLPRFDEYQSMLAEANSTLGITDIPSDVKTVTYYVLNGNTQASQSGITATGQNVLTSTDPDVVQKGLVRRQLDRAVSQYALANGLMASAEEADEVVATEVAMIEFQYFDGVEWRYEWDTEVEGTLPVAIQIIMMLEAPTAANLTGTNAEVASQEELEGANLNYYRLLVPVATGQAVEAEEDVSLEAAGI